MKVVVTGASGFIGRALVRELSRRGVNPVPVARSSLGLHSLGVVVKDYRETPSGDILIHLAEASDPAALKNQEAIHKERTVDRMDRLLEKGFQRIIYASSALVYGDQINHPRRPEETPTSSNIYSQVKLICEDLVLSKGGLCARLANVYGPDMADESVVSDILGQIPGEGDLKIRNDIPVRDFLWIEDAARGLADMTLGTEKGVFNLGSGTGTSIGRLAKLALEIADEADRTVKVLQSSKKKSHLILDISSTTNAFGWSPQVSLANGLSMLLEQHYE